MKDYTKVYGYTYRSCREWRGYKQKPTYNSPKIPLKEYVLGNYVLLLTYNSPRKYRDFAQKKNGCRYHSWSGLAFENVCLLHTKQIKHALGITGISSWEYSWSSRKSSPGVQIDLLIDRKDDVINICETKFTENEFEITAAYEKDLRRKVEVFREETGSEKSLQLTMISFSGIKHNAYKNVVVHDLTGEELFAR